LEQVKEYFGEVGSISRSGNMYIYEISSLKSLVNVRKHFEEYPLQTTKYVHFRLWCQVMDILENKEHLTKSGFNRVLSLKSVALLLDYLLNFWCPPHPLQRGYPRRRGD